MASRSALNTSQEQQKLDRTAVSLSDIAIGKWRAVIEAIFTTEGSRKQVIQNSIMASELVRMTHTEEAGNKRYVDNFN